MSTTYSPTAAAGLLGISVSSLRAWCAQFADVLSAGAAPGPGVERKLSEQDIAILLRVKDLRAQGMATEEIKATLQATDTASLQPYIDATATVPSTVVETPTEALQPAQGTMDIVAAFSAIQTQIQALQQAQGQAQREAAGRVTLLVGGILIGLGIAVLIFLSVVLINNLG